MWKKVVSASVALSACSDNKVINGVEYRTYGLFNQTDRRNPNVEYDVVWGNVFWGIVLSETIIAPIYFFGFDMFEPVGPKCSIVGAAHCSQ